METSSLLKKVNWLLGASIAVLLITIILGGSLLVSCDPVKSADIPPIDYTKEELIARGAYLVSTSACNDCHSPKIMRPTGPEPDPERLLSGHPASTALPKVNKSALAGWVLFNQDLTAAVGPWGVSFAANITSDETGIGNWNVEQFLTAIKKGKYKGLEGSRPLLPPMPWQVYKNMTDDDLRAIFAYLKTTKPVSNIVPSPIAPDQLQ